MASPLSLFSQDFFTVLNSCSPTLLSQLHITRKPLAHSASSTASSSPVTPEADGSVVDRAMTKVGSKQLQRLLVKSKPDDVDELVEGVKGRIDQLMTDTYGNYMCQKLFQTCSSAQRLELLEAMELHLVRIAMHTMGTHSLQVLIGLASLAEEEAVYERAFRGHVIRLSRHEFGSHVVQKLAMTLRARDFIIKPVAEFARELALDQLGLCVVKQLIDAPEVYNAIVPHCLELIQDPYGNYAVQRLLEVWGKSCHGALEAHLSVRLVQLSIQKYSSNVIEQCLAEPHLGLLFANKLMHVESLHMLLPNVYGCYVLKALKEAYPALSSKLVENIHQALERIHKNKLKGRLEQLRLLISR
jgi:hypothetical protein